MHCIFSTRQRRELISSDLQPGLWAYMGGIARENGMKALGIGGTRNHCHILLSLPAAVSIAKAMQLIKGGASRWVRETFADQAPFAWQEGYGAFSVSQSTLQATLEYIRNQEEHHRKRTFEQEYLEFPRRYGIEYDERFVFG